uniref:Uncharacterized protein n=1 Tax=Caenorhabditis japonica TaxID=281687 RepID=A0A8R1E0W4_CAEJA
MLPLLLLLLLFSARGAIGASGNCEATNYMGVDGAPEDALIYGITQDCQMFFIRPAQLHLLSTIRVDHRHSFCYANLVQLHVKSHDTLLLTFKQATNRICTLEVHIPALRMLFGDHLFRYSLLNSLPYASCSHSKDQSFQLEPDLSFLDPVYNDVIYFIDALSTGPNWKVLQFLLKDTGNMSMMNNLTVPVQTRSASANEFIVSIDNQRDKLYRRNRFDNLIYQQCGFETLFRPKESEVNSFEAPSRGYGAILNGQAVDDHTMVYVETDRSTDPPTSRLHMMSIDHPEHVACLSATSFSFDVGIISEMTMEKLKKEPRPPFGTKVTRRPTKHDSQPPKSSTPRTPSIAPKTTNSKPQKSKPASTTPTPSTTPSSATSSKSKESYSPSKSFFSYDMTGTLTTSDKVISNEIPVDEIKEEQEKEEEELNEIIKELKADDDEEEEEDRENEGIGELRARTRDVHREDVGGIEEIPKPAASNGTLHLRDASEASPNASSDTSGAEAVKTTTTSSYCVLVFSILTYLLLLTSH